MRFDDELGNLRSQSECRGDFVLHDTETINEVVVREGVPNGYGVYVMSANRDGHREIVYVGKAGTLRQDGSFKQQGLAKRLTMKQDGEYRARPTSPVPCARWASMLSVWSGS